MEIEDFDFDQDFLEGTQMYTFVDDDDDGLVDITDLNLPEPVPAAAAGLALHTLELQATVYYWHHRPPHTAHTAVNAENE